MAALIEITAEVLRERWRPPEPDSDYVVIETQIEGIKELVCVIGNAPRGEIVSGLTYRFSGSWQDDRKDRFSGRVEKQFKFQWSVKAEPHSRYGLTNYLAKYAPGIGPVIANRLFDEFGSEAVKVLREFPEKAVAVANVGGRQLLTLEKAEEAATKLKAMGKHEDTKIELATLFSGRGFPNSLAEQCIRVWGVLAPKRIARDPFSLLVRRLSGCGFARCNRLYEDLGLPLGRLKRQTICLWHSLRTDNEGHTWFPAEHCRRSLEGSIGAVVTVNFVRAIKLGLRSRWLAKRTDSEGRMWLAEYAKADNEKTVAERLAALLTEPITPPAFQTEIDETTAGRLSEIEDQTKESSDESGDSHDEDNRSENRAHRGGSEDAQGDASEPIQRQRDGGAEPFSIDSVELTGLRCRTWQLSSRRFTVLVVTDTGDIITDAAPVVRRFVGQPIGNLELWLSRQGGFERRPLSDGERVESHNERLARIGRERGICQFCSRELTHPTSRRLGYGPECGPKHGLPWIELESESEVCHV